MLSDATIDLLLLITRSTSILLAGAFGVLGLTVEYRRKDTGEITRWGRIALIGFVVSTTVLLASQTIQTVEDSRQARGVSKNKNAADQLERQGEMLLQLQRTLNPLEDVRLTYWLAFLSEDPAVRQYVRRIDDTAWAIAKGQLAHEIGYVDVSKSTSGPEQISIPQFSPLMPGATEVSLAHVVQYAGLTVEAYRKPFQRRNAMATCRQCNGKGEIPCIHCYGSGKGYRPDGKCNYCRGEKTQTCPECGGSGKA